MAPLSFCCATSMFLHAGLLHGYTRDIVWLCGCAQWHSERGQISSGGSLGGKNGGETSGISQLLEVAKSQCMHPGCQ